MTDKTQDKIKLTPAQIRVLRELAKPGALAQCTNGLTKNWWWLLTNYKKCTAQINILLKTGFVESEKKITEVRSLKRTFTVAAINESGRAFLAELDKASAQ